MKQAPDRDFLLRCLVRSGLAHEAAAQSADSIIRQWKVREADRTRGPGAGATVKCTVLAEVDEQGRVVDLTLKNQVLPLPDSIWETLKTEKAEFPTPGIRLVEAEVVIEQ